MKHWLLIAVLLIPVFGSRQGRGSAWGDLQEVTTTPQEGNYVHGTVVVVAQTRDGFVLAGDSLGTSQGGQILQYEYEKVFSVGQRAGCVVAGLIGATFPGASLADSVASHLKSLDDNAPTGWFLDATRIVRAFESAVKGEAALLPATHVESALAEISAVYVSPEGHSQWVTARMLPKLRTDFSGRPYPSVVPIIQDPLGSKVQVLGYRNIVNLLLGRSAPIPGERYSWSPGVRRYYDLKRSGRLEDLTLDDGISIARTLIEATIALAPTSAGVGGSIDVLTITKSGRAWVARKSRNIAPPVQLYRIREFNDMWSGDVLRIDGMQCVRCTFASDVKLIYGGTAEVDLAEPQFDGSCVLVLTSESRRSRPESVQRLINSLGGRCEIAEGDVAPTTGSSRHQERSGHRLPFPEVAISQYSRMSNIDLRTATLALAEDIKTFLETKDAERRSWSDFYTTPLFLPADFATREERAVQQLKQDYLNKAMYEQQMEEYRSRFQKDTLAVREEILRRVAPAPAQRAPMYYRPANLGAAERVVADLEQLANRL